METRIKDRGWVKNVAIVFLSVMLVLTFFSNTIMNRSLPEVATQSIGSNTITAQVRGTGRVSAAQNYEVKVDQTRAVKSVMVKVGQEVNAGDVLFVLSDADSDELEAAMDSLRSLKTSYQKALINASQSDYARENRNIQRARENLEQAEQKRDELQVSDMEMHAAEDAVIYAKDKVKAAQKKLDRAQEDLNDVGGKVETDSATVRALGKTLEAKEAAWDAAKETLNSAMYKYGTAYEKLEEMARPEIIKSIEESEEELAAYNKMTDKEKSDYVDGKLPFFLPYIVDDYVSKHTEDGVVSDDAKAYQAAYDEITACKQAVDDAKAERDSAQEAYDNARFGGNSSEYNSAARAVKKAQEALDAEQEKLTEAEERLSELKDRKREYETAAETVKNCEITLEDLVFSLQEQQKADNKAAQLERLDLQDLAAQVEKAQKRVEELRGDNGGNEITAAVPGVIGSIDITAGNKTSPDMPLATIELPDMGYTMSFSVTNEQARLIHAGDSATVSNYYYGSQIIATVASVKTDPKNPQTSKLVTFDLTGDVNAGADLTVSVGQRSQEYDFVVPNSALRSDSNGDFILVITAKNSPLGNRYIATRVDVTKIASDDTSTAVTGALNRGDFVITTSTKPIENGQQVRMQDN